MLILGVFETVQFFAALPPIHCLEKTKYERSLFYKHPLGQSNVQIIPKQPQNNLKKIKTFFTINRYLFQFSMKYANNTDNAC